jgi:outer membrane protein assembly factor BamB
MGRGSAMQRFPRLLGALLAAIGFAGMLAACEGQPCPVGLPAPPPVALFQDNGDLYFSSTGSASALRASDGSQRWQTQHEYFLGAGNALAFALSNKSLQALRASDHSLLWQHPLAAPYPFSAPLTVTDGVIYLRRGHNSSS